MVQLIHMYFSGAERHHIPRVHPGRASERTSEASVRAECLRIIKSPTIDKNSRYLVIKIS